MKTVHVVLAACAALTACSQAPADEGPAVPAPVTRADTGAADAALVEATFTWSAPNEVTWAGTNETTMMRFGRLAGTLANATDAPLVDPYVRCVFLGVETGMSGNARVKGTVPPRGRLVFTDLTVGSGGEPGEEIRCAFVTADDVARTMAARERQPSVPPGAIAVKHVVEDKPAI